MGGRDSTRRDTRDRGHSRRAVIGKADERGIHRWEGGEKAERWGRIHADQSGTTLAGNQSVVLVVRQSYSSCAFAEGRRLAVWRVGVLPKPRRTEPAAVMGGSSRQSCVSGPHPGYTRGTPRTHPGRCDTNVEQGGGDERTMRGERGGYMWDSRNACSLHPMSKANHESLSRAPSLTTPPPSLFSLPPSLSLSLSFLFIRNRPSPSSP